MKTIRKSNFEWLRILAMAMIVTLHYMFKGEVVTDPAANMTASNLIMWLITSMSICAVNVYVLISGYFLVESEAGPKRIIELIVQVLEYGIVITIIMVATGAVPLSSLSVYELVKYILPIGTENYWFISAYVVMYLLSPVLSAGVKAISEKQLRIGLLLLIGLLCVEKTILPINLPADKAGYDFGWFIVLYLLAAYIRLYGIKTLEGKKARSLLLYILASLLIWGTCVAGSVLNVKTGMETFAHYAATVFDYNHVFVLIAAVALFYVFKNSEFNETGKLADVARNLGPLTLGVYLLHEHLLLRYDWYEWFGILTVKASHSLLMQIGHWLLCVVIAMILGLLIEWIRKTLMKFIIK